MPQWVASTLPQYVAFNWITTVQFCLIGLDMVGISSYLETFIFIYSHSQNV